MKQTLRLAFTLIELLIVVAIIAVLAGISVPNFLEAQVRSKIARSHADMAVVTQGLRSYFADYNVYPRHRDEVHQFLEACSQVDEVNAQSVPTPADARYSWTGDDPGELTRPGNAEGIVSTGGFTSMNSFPILSAAAWDLAVLTTPIAYIGGSLPPDPFHNFRGTPFTYINLSELESSSASLTEQSGPFRRYVYLSYGPNTDSAKPDFLNPVRGPWLQYDPTNGTVSPGDILRFGYDDSSINSSPTDLPAGTVRKEKPGNPPGVEVAI